MSSTEGTSPKASDDAKGAELNNLMKGLQSKENSETGSSNGGNNSDNSALVSIGNNSFGFNFDSEEGNSKEGNNSNNDNTSNDSNEDSDGNGQSEKTPVVAGAAPAPVTKKRTATAQPQQQQSASIVSASVTSGSDKTFESSVSSLTAASSDTAHSSAEHKQAAADAVASLESIVRSFPKPEVPQSSATEEQDLKRKAESTEGVSATKDADSGGYNTDDEAGNSKSQSVGSSVAKEETTATTAKPRKKARANDGKREERNQREKERSFRISKQITDLRNLLSSGGVIVPKGTKSSVLTEAANYIRLLQQHQYKSEIDRHQLVQQMQMIGQGANGPQAAQAIQHFAAQNGVWSLGNFGGVPPKSAMTFYQAPATTSSSIEAGSPGPTQSANQPAEAQGESNIFQQDKVDASEYRFIFNSCGAGMAIASMGGAFIDCNQLFCQLSNYSKQEICSQTIFNLTARQDLQLAFDQISQLISPPMSEDIQAAVETKPTIIRGSMNAREDLGLSITLVKGADGVAKCFCVTLVKNPASPFDTCNPVPVSFDAIQQDIQLQSTSSTLVNKPADDRENDMNTAPAFTSG